MNKPSSDTKDRILESARYLFWEQGYAATGMADILKRAKANSGSFYHFFDSKEALLLAVLDSYLGGLEPIVIRPVCENEPNPLDRIFAMLAGYRDRLLQTECRYGCPLGRLALEIDADNRGAHQRIAANFDAWTGWIQRWLEESRSRLPADLDLHGLSRFILTVMEGAVMQSRTHRSLQPFDQSVAQLRDYFRRLTEVNQSTERGTA
ncbi:MAG: TetR/AcrR family transcriptional regulator [Acidobacteriota bacterium]|nr:TetR/AcrR family transcriptional regulator [Acidobacteriota bacterium]